MKTCVTCDNPPELKVALLTPNDGRQWFPFCGACCSLVWNKVSQYPESEQFLCWVMEELV